MPVTSNFYSTLIFDPASVLAAENFLRPLANAANYSVISNTPYGWLIALNTPAGDVARIEFRGGFQAFTPGVGSAPPLQEVGEILLYNGSGTLIGRFSTVYEAHVTIAELIAQPGLLVSVEDNFTGSAGNDQIHLGAGADQANGGLGNDRLYGDDGDDRLTDAGSVTDQDVLNGGAGNDVLTGNQQDIFDGGTGNDTALIYLGTFSGSGVAVSFADYNGASTFAIAGGGTIVGVETLVLIGTVNDDQLTGSSLADELHGGRGTDRLYGGGGDDRLVVNSLTQYLTGNYGGEIWDGGAGFDTIVLADWLDIRGAQRPTISSIEAISFGAVGSTVTLMVDNLFIANLPANFQLTGDLAATQFDTLVIDFAAGGTNMNLSQVVLSNWAAVQDRVQITGNALANIITGTAGSDVLDGGAGIDQLFGGGGDDVILVQSNGGGTASAYAGEVWNGGEGLDVVLFMTSIDFRGAAWPVITGIEGFSLNSAYSQALVLVDTGFLAMLPTPIHLTGNQNVGVTTEAFWVDMLELQTSFDMSSWVLTTWVIEDGISSWSATDDYIRVNGNSLNNTLTGSAGSNRLYGFDGNDTLISGGAADLLDGGTGDDVMVGRTGSVFYGGDGFDTVVFTQSDFDSYGSIGVTRAITGVERIEFEAEVGQTTAALLYLSQDETIALLSAGGQGLQIVGSDGWDTLKIVVEAGMDGNVVLDLSALPYTTSNFSAGAGGLNDPRDALFITVRGSQWTGSFTVTGSSGNDILQGGSHNNILHGGDGNDILWAGYGKDKLYGGDGDDYLIVENLGGDYTGTFGYDVWDGGDGFDSIAIASDADFRYLRPTATYPDGPQIPTITGIEGIAFKQGTVVTQGYPQPLTLTLTLTELFLAELPTALRIEGALNQSDRIVVLLTAAGTLDISAWTFVNWTGSGPSTVLSDTIELVGTDGSDSLIGTTMDDVLAGGLGDDVLNGGGGFDTASYAEVDGSVTIDLRIVGAQSTGAAGTDTLIGIERIIGTFYADVLIGNSLANALSGGSGNDQISGGGGDDVLAGDYGNDELNGGDGADTLTGDYGEDRLDGGAGADYMDGGYGDDVYYVDFVDDVVVDMSGADTIYASVSYDLVSNDIEAIIFTGSASIVGHGNASFNRMTGSQTAINTFYGGGGNDTLNGGGLGDFLYGEDGSDTLSGGAGNDTLAGGLWADAVYGDAGDDTIAIRQGDFVAGEVLNGGSGTDTLHTIGLNIDYRVGELTSIERVQFTRSASELTLNMMINATQIGGTGLAANVVLAGSAAQDSVQVFVGVGGSVNLSTWTFSYPAWGFEDYIVYVGDSGNETFVGFPGLDVFFGSPGNDSFDGGGAFDFAAYIFSPNAVTVDLAIVGAQVIGGNQGSDTLINIDGLAGSQLNDFLYGNSGANIIQGMYGNDVIDGRGGDDDIRGLEGADTLTGGTGADTFRLTSATELTQAAADTITDFVHGTDHVDLSLIRTGASDTFQLVVVGSNTRLDVDLGGNGSIDVVINFTGVSNLTSADIIWTGGSGAPLSGEKAPVVPEVSPLLDPLELLAAKPGQNAPDVLPGDLPGEDGFAGLHFTGLRGAVFDAYADAGLEHFVWRLQLDTPLSDVAIFS